MPGLISTHTNDGMSDDVRTFSRVFVIPQPIEGMEVAVWLAAPFPVEILRVYIRTQDGSCEVELFNDNETVEFEEADTSGGLDVIEGDAQVYTPSSTDPANYIVSEFSRLAFIIDLTSTILNGFEMQIDFRRLQENDQGT